MANFCISGNRQLNLEKLIISDNGLAMMSAANFITLGGRVSQPAPLVISRDNKILRISSSVALDNEKNTRARMFFFYFQNTWVVIKLSDNVI